MGSLVTVLLQMFS